MSPTIQQGDVILVSRFTRPKINDILVVKHPTQHRYLVKRLISQKRKTIYLLGDNRKESHDSRSFGWISKHAIIGKVITKI